MKIFIKLTLTFLLPCYSHLSYSQENHFEVGKGIENEFDSMKVGNYIANDHNFDSSYAQYYLSIVKKYENDKDVLIRMRVQNFKFKIAYNSKNLSVRQKVVEDFISDFSDTNPGISSYAGNRLKFYNEADFSEKARQMLLNSFEKNRGNPIYFLICGIAQIKSVMPKLELLSKNFNRNESAWYNSVQWYSMLALSRLGATSKVDNLIASVELERDVHLKIMILLSDIAYTRQRDCLKLLLKYLESSDSFYENNLKGQMFNQVVMNYLISNIDNFPIAQSDIGYSDVEIKKAIDYLKKQLDVN